MQVHLNAAQVGQAQEGELSLNFIKKYIGYCRKYVLIDQMRCFFFIILEFYISIMTVIKASSCM